MKLRLATILILAAFLLAFAGPSTAQSDEKVNLGIITVKQKDLANQLAKELAKGASFETLAKRNSVGPASFRGGRLGKVPYSRLRSEYRAALEGLAPGKPSKVIPTEEGYTILMRFDQPAETKKLRGGWDTNSRIPALVSRVLDKGGHPLFLHHAFHGHLAGGSGSRPRCLPAEIRPRSAIPDGPPQGFGRGGGAHSRQTQAG